MRPRLAYALPMVAGYRFVRGSVIIAGGMRDPPCYA